MAVRSKQGIKPESLPPTEGSAWQHSLRVIYKPHTGKSEDTIKSLTGAGKSQWIT